ncbi:NADH dehydrogenase (quinone) [Rhodococcus ruber BKS 20-38]|uniref:NADH-quinone oxidoreductase subunit N n=2 Tax=Rhodococcus ruber TaxID=1830 RepID=M2Z9V6_9NOCA|nr:NADH dehydrogenase (quinone) [Rhodococcus ruber BKS 20-38]
MQPLTMLPEMVLFGTGLAVLLAGSFLPRTRQWWTRIVAATGVLGCGTAAALAMTGPDRAGFEGTFVIDTATSVARMVAATAVLCVLAVAGGEIAGSARESETYALLLFATTGILVLAGAADLLVLITGFLLTSIPLYGLIGVVRSPQSAEAALKTYLLGALFGIVLLLGVSLLSGITGTTRYDELTGLLGDVPVAVVAAGFVGVTAGLLFEAGAVPGHFWVPDAAQGAGGIVAMFLTTVPKVGALIALYRLATIVPDTVAWPRVLAVLAVASMTLGNLAAYGQRDPRRLLGWSTVGQVGFLLVPITVTGRSDLALPSLLFYLAAYTVTNIAAFAVTTSLPEYRDLSDYRGLSRSRPWLAGALLVALLGLVGTPPTGVFVGKLTTATAAWDGGRPWLAVAVFVTTLISLFYYLRWIVPAYLHRPEPDDSRVCVPESWSAGAAVITAGLSLVLGMAAGMIWGLITP